MYYFQLNVTEFDKYSVFLHHLVFFTCLQPISNKTLLTYFLNRWMNLLKRFRFVKRLIESESESLSKGPKYFG
jgi:hypothetical protein